jgi:hypothetical protein
MPIGQITLSLKSSLSRLQANRASEAVRIAGDGMALSIRRVQQTGKDSDGQSFPDYSKKQVPKYFFYGRSRSAGAETRVRNAKLPTLSYADFREANNLQTKHKDFTFTGQMFRNTGVSIQSNTGSVTTVSIGGRSDYSQKLLGYHAEKYGGSLLRSSTAEFRMIVDAWKIRTLKAIQL